MQMPWKRVHTVVKDNCYLHEFHVPRAIDPKSERIIIFSKVCSRKVIIYLGLSWPLKPRIVEEIGIVTPEIVIGYGTGDIGVGRVHHVD